MNEQETNSGAHGGAAEIVKKYIGQIGDACTEGEMDLFAQLMHTDLALELMPPRLEVFSIKVRDAV